MAFIKNIFVSVLFIILGTLFLAPETVFAEGESCGSAVTQFVWGCNLDCSPRIDDMTYQCFSENGGPCSGWVNGWYCQKTGRICTLVKGNDVLIPCGSGGGGGGGGGGGSYSCPGGTYSQRLDECRNACTGGWRSGGDCDPNPCGNNAQGDPKVCCHKGVCTPEKTQNFSFSCNSDNTVTFAWNVNPAATRYALRVDDLSNGWAGDQKNNNCTTINPGDACVNDLPIDPTLYTFPITYGNVYNAWIYTVAGSRMSEEASYLYNMTCAAPTATPTPTPFPCTSGFNVSCAGSGAQATISWNAISGAAAYFCRGRS